MATAVTNAIRRLQREKNDDSINCIDLRGKLSSAQASEEDQSQVVLELTKTIAQNYSSRLKVLSLHNNFLRKEEIHLLISVLDDLHLLEKVVVFHHDLGDDLVELLVDTFTGSRSENNRLRVDTSSSPAADGAPHSQSTKSALKELYLSHCNIGCKGALKIVDAMVGPSSEHKFNRLKYLRVLSLGSNKINKKGASFLAKMFAWCPSLHRLVLHGNEGLSSSDTNEFVQCVLDPNGWQQSTGKQHQHAVPMSIISPLIMTYVESRWKRDRVLLRPYDLARENLLKEMYKNHSTFVDDMFEEIPELLSWIGRVGMCSKPPNCQSQQSGHERSLSQLAMCHSYGCKECSGCSNTHLNDVYVLIRRMPHLAKWFRNMKCARE